MAADTALLLKQYRDLARNIESFSDGQAKLKELEQDDETSLENILITLSPKDGPYRGGKFDFEIDASTDYPSCPPVIHCLTQIYHPNIDFSDDSGEVCLNLLDELWTSDMTLEDVVQGLLFLLHNPNVDDPLSCLFTGTESEEEFLENVRQSLRGEEVDGVSFERNLPDDFETHGSNSGIRPETGQNEGVETTGEVSSELSKPTTKTVDTTVDSTSTELRHNGTIESSVDKEDYIIPITATATTTMIGTGNNLAIVVGTVSTFISTGLYFMSKLTFGFDNIPVGTGVR